MLLIYIYAADAIIQSISFRIQGTHALLRIEPLTLTVNSEHYSLAYRKLCLVSFVLSHTGQGDREADASTRWFIQYNSGRVSNIGDITEKALEAGCAVSR